MLKFIGAVFILIAAALFGFLQALHYARRPKQIRGLIGALQRMETEMTYALTPLPELLEALSRQTAEPIASLYRVAAERLMSTSGISTREIWQQEVKETWIRTSMKLPEQEIMLQLGHVLGMSDRGDQVKHLHLAVSQLQLEEADSREEQRKYEKMWKSLGILIGALLVILMY
jgi:stage III sporulation protein AB